MSNIVNLTVHKNTKAQRERKKLRELARVSLKKALNVDEIDGFFVASWNNEGDVYACRSAVDSSTTTQKDVENIIKETIELLKK